MRRRAKATIMDHDQSQRLQQALPFSASFQEHGNTSALHVRTGVHSTAAVECLGFSGAGIMRSLCECVPINRQATCCCRRFTAFGSHCSHFTLLRLHFSPSERLAPTACGVAFCTVHTQSRVSMCKQASRQEGSKTGADTGARTRSGMCE